LSRTAADLRRAQRFNPIPLSESKSQFRKCPGTTERVSKKIGIALDILHPSGVLFAAIKPHRLDGDGQWVRLR
jgi:hypothetical protein